MPRPAVWCYAGRTCTLNDTAMHTSEHVDQREMQLKFSFHASPTFVWAGRQAYGQQTARVRQARGRGWCAGRTTTLYSPSICSPEPEAIKQTKKTRKWAVSCTCIIVLHLSEGGGGGVTFLSCSSMFGALVRLSRGSLRTRCWRVFADT